MLRAGDAQITLPGERWSLKLLFSNSIHVIHCKHVGFRWCSCDHKHTEQTYYSVIVMFSSNKIGSSTQQCVKHTHTPTHTHTLVSCTGKWSATNVPYISPQLLQVTNHKRQATANADWMLPLFIPFIHDTPLHNQYSWTATLLPTCCYVWEKGGHTVKSKWVR